MKKRARMYLKLNILSVVFVVISFISVTLAWFVYSGISGLETTVNVKAWYVELERNGEKASNNIVISLDNIYPGMDTVTESIKIKNRGDSDAQVKYRIDSAKILDLENFNLENGNISEDELLEKLALDYPFQVSMSLDKNFVLAKNDETEFNISISWPLDSGNDELDSYWGNEAYRFKTTNGDEPSVKILVSLIAEQYIESDDSSDLNYPLGKEILYDVVTKSICTNQSSTCLKMNVIDVNNKVGDNTVKLLPDISSITNTSDFNSLETNYNNLVSEWNVNTKMLEATDILNIISLDVFDSMISIPNISNSIIGNISSMNGLNNNLNKVKNSNGYYIFSNEFSYLISNDCYWLNTEYNSNQAFAIKTYADASKMYGETKTTNCKIIPVIVASKSELKTN